ncbi:toll/interleukin-1 receptor domain-containing protein [Luteolibacter sp. LG18]|uniref:toll/interleukin-1 receptor domain-containing protein n=1 Tax=Luteolibacter sp. LG18 TaxID=2819286 RepID=UPI0030C6B30E
MPRLPKSQVPKKGSDCSLKFEAAAVESLFSVLDAVAWLDLPDIRKISQFAGIDPRTAGKLLKNCVTIGLLESINDESYLLTLPYPYKGSSGQKKAVVREALVKMPLMIHLRQFMKLGDVIDDGLRKAATVVGVVNYAPSALAPLVKWAKEMGALERDLIVEDLVDEATAQKEERHSAKDKELVVFLSHSSKDKPFVRQLAADLTNAGVTVWLDERRILVGDSIVEKIGQGLAESDFFLIVLSENSVVSEWVKRELNNALFKEVEKRDVHILPIRLDECEVPPLIVGKKYADFSKSYKDGLSDLLQVFESKRL